MLVSILGDSISTYSGYNPKGYEVYYDDIMQMRNGLGSVYDTWWARVNQALGAYLCVNNSYSGSRVSGKDFPAGCCQERIMNLRTSEYRPDLILVYLGFNDFGYGVPVSCAPQSNDGKRNLLYFEDAYYHMLTGLCYFYPNTKIICATLMRTTLQQNIQWDFPDRLGGICIDDYNEAIRRAASNCHVDLADLAKPHLSFKNFSKQDCRYETLDGAHPTEKGHQTIANEWIRCLSDKLRLFFLLILFSVFFCSYSIAQNTIRIHSKNGGVYEVQTENVDSITFGDSDSLNVAEVELAGSWLWGSAEKGYYELLSFSKDHTYTAYDNYFTYGFDTTTYGFYSQYSAMLTLWSYGFGYQRRYNWYITGLSDNALSVMTKMGPFTYYRLQPETLNIHEGGYLECEDGDSFVFADGVVVSIEDGKLYGAKSGTTYILKYIASSGLIYAYKTLVS